MSLSVTVLSPWAFYNQFITLQWLIISDVCTIATFHFHEMDNVCYSGTTVLKLYHAFGCRYYVI